MYILHIFITNNSFVCHTNPISGSINLNKNAKMRKAQNLRNMEKCVFWGDFWVWKICSNNQPPPPSLWLPMLGVLCSTGHFFCQNMPFWRNSVAWFPSLECGRGAGSILFGGGISFGRLYYLGGCLFSHLISEHPWTTCSLFHHNRSHFHKIVCCLSNIAVLKHAKSSNPAGLELFSEVKFLLCPLNKKNLLATEGCKEWKCCLCFFCFWSFFIFFLHSFVFHISRCYFCILT